MADETDISQFITEVAADASEAQVSQLVVEVAADASEAQIAQLAIEVAANASGVQIAQLTIELALGSLVPPPPPGPDTSTFVFDEGEATVEWWIVPQLTDSGVELRDKVVKAVRVTGLVTDADVKVYTYGPSDPVVVGDLEDGINSVTGAIPLPDTTNVAQSPRLTANCSNAMLSTVRVAGTYAGTGPRNRVDEILYELAQQGVRR